MQDLSNLKVGDKVILSGRWYDETIEKIDKITPSGLIKINGSYFYKDGTQRCSDVWGRSRIRICTEADEIEIKQRNFCNNALKVMHGTKSISYENAIKIMLLLGV